MLSAASVLQVPGCTLPETVLTALRKLPSANPKRDQDCFVTLVAEVVMDGKHLHRAASGSAPCHNA